MIKVNRLLKNVIFNSYHINPDCVILKANFQYIGEMIVETCLLKFNLPLRFLIEACRNLMA